VVIALGHRQVIGGAWIGGIRQLFEGESPHRLIRPRPGHPLGLGIVGNTARHVEEAADGDVLPRWILRQPLAERVVDRQFSRRLELEDHCHGERLRGASHLAKRVLVDPGLSRMDFRAQEIASRYCPAEKWATARHTLLTPWNSPRGLRRSDASIFSNASSPRPR